MSANPNVEQTTTALIYSEAQADFDLGPTHPLKPVRYRYAHELMRASGLLDDPRVREYAPRPATLGELERYHDHDYVEAVKAISAGNLDPLFIRFGFGTADNPPVRGIYDAASLTCGGTVVACELVTRGVVRNAFAMAGGVHHHAMAGRASGFGVFNDAVVAIKGLVEAGLRVAYIDIDCHHGDGVQAGFYNDPRVLTISLHESGQFLFPGTGFVDEIGEGAGEGYSINVPLAPYTSDGDWLWAFDQVVPSAVRAFKPDLVFAQLGIDTHYKDPITHMRLTTQGFAAAVARLKALGEATPRGLVAVGGGGYDLSAVARSWTMALAVLAGVELPERIPPSFTALRGLTTFSDEPPPSLPPEHEEQIHEHAQRVVAAVKEVSFPRLGV